jgi:hypothetical protein
MQETSGWTILTYVLWMLHGNDEEPKTLETLLGPDVAKEDHSGLKINQCIYMFWETPLEGEPFPACSQSSQQMIRACTPKQILEFRGKFKPRYTEPTSLYGSHLILAETLLNQAIERIQTYPKWLIKALTDACVDSLPTQALYAIIASYMCH